jgi:hypothetical protein
VKVTNVPLLPLPRACRFQEDFRQPDVGESVRCLLPPGVCVLQRGCGPAGGEPAVACSDPHGIITDWQVIDAAAADRSTP